MKSLSRTIGSGPSMTGLASSLPVRLIDYFEQLKRTHCGNHDFLRNSLQIEPLFNSWRSSGKLSPAIKCRICGVWRCAGCQRSFGVFSNSRRIIGNIDIDWCCERGRFFLIWALLCGLDVVIAEKNVRQPTTTFNSIPVKSTFPAYPLGGYVEPNGFDMFGDADFDSFDFIMPRPTTKQANGTGYGGGGSYERRAQTALQDAPEDQKDRIIADVLAVVTELLPVPGASPPSWNMNPPLLLVEVLRASAILDKVAELLRNDSIDNVTKRHYLYRRVLSFVRALDKHPQLWATVYDERPVKPEGVTLYGITGGRAKYKPKETAQPVASNLQNICKQAQVIIKVSNRVPSEYMSPEAQTQITLCNQIIELSGMLSNSRTSTQHPMSRIALGSLEQWHKERCVEEVPDHIMMQDHSFYQNVIRTNWSQKGRMRKLVEQIANMKTSLPPGVFVRHALSRPDVMKALIIGPADTPYENGLFEFDIFCPSNYPTVPPTVQFRTTGRGTVSFNPNLYTDGKVCLSLLGTFAGQPWMPGQSTLLQVLVSIQSMIFCEKPFFNEPGNDRFFQNETVSQRYNSIIHASTIHHAMIEWMRKSRHPIWGEIIIRHFRESAPKIMGVTSRWKVEAVTVGSVSPTKPMYSDPLTATHHLNPYGANHVAGAVQQLNKAISEFLMQFSQERY